MKNDTLQQLLTSYRQGTISDEELERLNQLTHKDEVMAAAAGRAKVIVRRRTMRMVAFSVAGLAVLGLGIWAVAPSPDAPMVAQRQECQQTAVEAEAEVSHIEDVAPTSPTMAVPPKAAKANSTAAAVAAEAVAAAPSIASPVIDEPTVMCNNQCDADSVINDIWKFLTA